MPTLRSNALQKPQWTDLASQQIGQGVCVILGLSPDLGSKDVSIAHGCLPPSHREVIGVGYLSLTQGTSLK